MHEKRKITPSTMYLIVLIFVVLCYAFFLYPRLKSGLDTLASQQLSLQEEVTRLEQFEPEMEQIHREIAQLEIAYDSNHVLTNAGQFTDILFESVRLGGVRLEGFAISDATDIVLPAGYAAKLYSANLTVTLAPGTSLLPFLQALESQEGSGVFVASLQMTPSARLPEQGPDPLGEEREAAALQTQRESDLAAQTEANNAYYALRTRANRAAQDARTKAAQAAAAPENAALAVDAQIAAQLAAELAAQLEAQQSQRNASAGAQDANAQETRDTVLLTVNFYTADK